MINYNESYRVELTASSYLDRVSFRPAQGAAMFARRVYMHLKADCVAELTKKLDKEAIPMLRKLKGFQDQITFVTQSGTEAFATSLWDRAESAEVYNRTIYPAVMNIVSKYIDGTPQVETFDVTNSTFHKIVPAVSV